MKIGFGRAFKSLAPDFLVYADIWDLLLKNKPTATKPRFGSGSYDDPYIPLGVSDWFWLSQQAIGDDAVFIKVANRLIAKWGGKAGGLKSYTSDVTEIEPALFADQMQASGRVRELAELGDKGRKFNMDESVYTRKARRVEKVSAHAATIARQILWGHPIEDQDAFELANSIAGLLISEGGADRDASKGGVFLCTMMLLDLVERNIEYGNYGQRYTWESMLMHAGPKNIVPDAIPGRHAKSRDNTTLGKHPMAGLGTVKMGKNLNQPTLANEARNRIVSVATAWLANYLAEDDLDRDYKYYFVKTTNRAITPKSPSELKSYLFT